MAGPGRDARLAAFRQRAHREAWGGQEPAGVWELDEIGPAKFIQLLFKQEARPADQDEMQEYKDCTYEA